MKLNNIQIERAQKIWQDYVSNGEKVLNANKEYSEEELDQRGQGADLLSEVRG